MKLSSTRLMLPDSTKTDVRFEHTPVRWLVPLVLLATISSIMSAPPDEKEWKSSLQVKLPDFESATGVHLLSSGAAETIAAKFERLQKAVATLSNGTQTLPIFIDPAVALEVVPAQQTERLGAPLKAVPVEEV